MSEYQLSPPQAHGFELDLVEDLQLEPEIEEEVEFFQALEAALAALRSPDWERLGPVREDLESPIRSPSMRAHASSPSFTLPDDSPVPHHARSAFPEVRRLGRFGGDIFAAIWSYPEVRELVELMLVRARSIWHGLPRPRQRLLASGLVIAGVGIGAFGLGYRRTREPTLDLLLNREYPIPGATGFSVALESRRYIVDDLRRPNGDPVMRRSFSAVLMFDPLTFAADTDNRRLQRARRRNRWTERRRAR